MPLQKKKKKEKFLNLEMNSSQDGICELEWKF